MSNHVELEEKVELRINSESKPKKVKNSAAFGGVRLRGLTTQQFVLERAPPLTIEEGDHVTVLNGDRQNLTWKMFTLQNLLEDGTCVVESEARYKMVPRTTVKPKDYVHKLRAFFSEWGFEVELHQFQVALEILGAKYDLGSLSEIFQLLDVSSDGLLKFHSFFNWAYGLGRQEDRGRILTTLECVAGLREWNPEIKYYILDNVPLDDDRTELRWYDARVIIGEETDDFVTLSATDGDVNCRVPKDLNAWHNIFTETEERTRNPLNFRPCHPDNPREMSIVVVGGGEVGKSAFLQRFVRGTFQTNYDPTIEDGYRKQIMVDQEPAMLHILDTAGQEEFASMRYQWLREVDVLMVCFTAQNVESFHQMQEHLEVSQRLFRQDDPPRKVPIMIIETQTDLEDSGVEVDEKEIATFLESKRTSDNALYSMRTSAFSDYNVADTFEEAVKLFRRFKDNSYDSDDVQDRTASQTRAEVVAGSGGPSCVCCDNVTHRFSMCCPSLTGLVTKEQERTVLIGQVPREKIPDGMPDPVFSTRHFSIERNFSFTIFIVAEITGIFFPIVLLLQTLMFLFYSPTGSFMVNMLDKRDYYNTNVAIIFDFLHPIVGRDPEKQLTEEDKIDSRRWFLSQTLSQKLLRILIAPLVSGLFTLALYNFGLNYRKRLSQTSAGLQLALMEDFGPVALWSLVWTVLALYLAFAFRVTPSIPNLVELRPFVIYFGEFESIRTTAYVFLRNFNKSTSSNQRLEATWFRINLSVAMAVVYGLIPGVTRVAFKRNFVPSGFEMQTISAFFINSALLFVLTLTIQIQLLSGLQNYTTWMEDVTAMLDVEAASDRKVPYISLKRHSNGISWMEMRTYLYSGGLRIFARQEIFIFSLLGISLCEAVYLVYRLLTDIIPVYQSESFNGLFFVFMICIIALYRLLLRTRRVEDVQHKQSALLSVQGFSVNRFRLALNANQQDDDSMNDMELAPSFTPRNSKGTPEPYHGRSPSGLSPTKLKNITQNDGSSAITTLSGFNKEYLRDSEVLIRDITELVRAQEIIPRVFGVKLDVFILLGAMATFFSTIPTAAFIASGSPTGGWST